MSNTWKMEFNLDFIGLSTYLAVNTLLLGNKKFNPV